jgi:hypothetical protein
MVPRPSEELLRASTNDNAPSAIYYELPDGFPDVARDAAQFTTREAVTAFDKMIALQNWFRTQFEYDLNVQLGNSNDAIESFLLYKRGFCQQFAGTFAAMARSLGLPARVAVGFTQGLLGNDNRYHVFGRNAHAWPEVWFDSAGWVAFEPTPGRGSGDTADYTGVAFAQDDSVAGGSGEEGEVPGDVAGSTTAPLVTSGIEDGSEGPNTGPGDTSVTSVAPGTGSGGGDSTSALPFVLLGALMLLLTWIALAPRVIGSRVTRHAGSPPQRVIGAWHRTLASLVMAGAPRPAGATPLEYATVAERSTGIDHHILREMATHVTRTVYSRGEINEHAALRCELLSREVIGICRDRTPLPLRLKSLIDPRLMRLRHTG